MYQNIINFFIGSYEELKKVVWPTRKEVTNHTVIVIVSIIVGMALIALIDAGLKNLILYLLSSKL